MNAQGGNAAVRAGYAVGAAAAADFLAVCAPSPRLSAGI